METEELVIICLLCGILLLLFIFAIIILPQYVKQGIVVYTKQFKKQMKDKREAKEQHSYKSENDEYDVNNMVNVSKSMRPDYFKAPQ